MDFGAGGSRAEDLQARSEAFLRECGLDFHIDWQIFGRPFLTLPGGRLRDVVISVCRGLCQLDPDQNIGGSFSGCFIALLGNEIVEIDPVKRLTRSMNVWPCRNWVIADRLSDLSKRLLS